MIYIYAYLSIFAGGLGVPGAYSAGPGLQLLPCYPAGERATVPRAGYKQLQVNKYLFLSSIYYPGVPIIFYLSFDLSICLISHIKGFYALFAYSTVK